jgi:hypothetical protein
MGIVRFQLDEGPPYGGPFVRFAGDAAVPTSKRIPMPFSQRPSDHLRTGIAERTFERTMDLRHIGAGCDNIEHAAGDDATVGVVGETCAEFDPRARRVAAARPGIV